MELVYGKCNIRVAVLEKSNIFGFMAFFAEEPRAFSAKSLDFTTVFELPRELFIQKFKEFPGEKVPERLRNELTWSRRNPFA